MSDMAMPITGADFAGWCVIKQATRLTAERPAPGRFC